MTMNSSLRDYMAYQTPQQQEQHKYASGTSNHSVSSQRSHQGNHGQHHQTQDYMSVGSHYSRSSMGSSHNSSQVDEAYRRLGRRLSIRAHGEQAISKPQAVSSIGMTQTSGFMPYDEESVRQDYGLEGLPASPGSLNRTAKVAKTRYSDHGDHHKVPSRKSNILRKMTMNATELFRLMQSDTDSTPPKGKKKRHSPRQHMPHIRPHNATEDISPQRFAFSQLALDGSLQHTNGKQQPSNQLGHNNHGLLSAVIEASSSHTSSQIRGCESSSKLSRSNSMDSSIATKASLDTKPSMASYRTLPLGKCLTQPSTPVANEGLDNADGNLVVHENDVIRISRKQIHVLTKDKMRDVTQADFRIQSLLGQGTFAQVFQCLHLQTGKLVAIKIVKNKPAYTRQAAVELDVFRALTKRQENVASSSMSQNRLSVSPNNSVDGTVTSREAKWDYMVDLVCYFVYKSHLCLVFELLGLNLYEVLKQRQFRGLPLSVVRTLVKQAVGGVAELAKKSIVHCDLKPENILLVTDDDVNSVVGATRSAKISSSFEQTTASELTKAINGNRTPPKKRPVLPSGLSKAMGGNQGSAVADGSAGVLSRSSGSSLGTAGTRRMDEQKIEHEQKIKLIDFGSACFEGQTTHTYIQSRFYRSPEVLIGLPYDSAIDMWSLGCVAGELFLGLPILPGVHEHDQLGRISEMISILPNWMLDQGSKSSKYFVKDVPRSKENQTETPELQDPSSDEGSKAPPSPQPLQQWRIRSQEEYIASLSQNEIKKKGGLAKLEKQPTNRYFKKRKLADIISHKGQSGQPEDKHDLDVFIHFLYGILDPDPWKRWTAHQAAQHPFITFGPIGKRGENVAAGDRKVENHGNLVGDLYWEPPLDPGICRRKLLNVQKVRELHQAARRGGYSNSRAHGSRGHRRQHSTGSHDGAAFARGSRISDIQDNGSIASHQGQQRGLRMGDTAPMPPPAPPQLQSSSLVGFPNQTGVSGHFVGDGMETRSITASTNNSQHGLSDSQSYSDTVYSGMMQGSYSDLDFAHALRRPGVVPMGGSVSSSVDMSISLQQQYQQEDYHHQQQTAGSYGANLRHQTGLRRPGVVPMGGSVSSSVDMSVSLQQQYQQEDYHHQQQTAGYYGTNLCHQTGVQQLASDPSGPAIHSFGEAAVGTAPGPYTQQLPPYGAQGNLVSQGGFAGNTAVNQNGIIQHRDKSLEMGNTVANSHIGPNSAISNDVLLYGNAQAYLQQQHAALHQQQVMLQQQQAALALQQQQLQAYGMNPVLLNGNQSNLTGAQFNNMNEFGQTGGGYYYVASADGNPRNHGIAPQGMVAHNGMAGQQQHNIGGYGNPRGGNNPMMSPPGSNQYTRRGGTSM